MRSQVFRVFVPNAWEGEAQLCKYCLVPALPQLNKEGSGKRREEILSSTTGGTLGNERMKLHCFLQALLVCYACNSRMAECQISYTIKMAPTQSHLEMQFVILKQNPPFLFKNSQQFNYAKYFSPQEASGCCINSRAAFFEGLRLYIQKADKCLISESLKSFRLVPRVAFYKLTFQFKQRDALTPQLFTNYPWPY